MILTLDSLVEMGANVKLEVTSADLKMFAESIAQRMVMTYDDGELEQAATAKTARSITTRSRYVSYLMCAMLRSTLE